MDSDIHKNGAMQKVDIHQTLAEKLREIRTQKGLTQAELGKRAGCGQSHISRIEKQTMVTGPTIEALNDIAYVLGIQAWELLVDSEATRQAAYHRMIVGGSEPEIRDLRNPVVRTPPQPPQTRAVVHKQVKKRR